MNKTLICSSAVWSALGVLGCSGTYAGEGEGEPAPEMTLAMSVDGQVGEKEHDFFMPAGEPDSPSALESEPVVHICEWDESAGECGPKVAILKPKDRPGEQVTRLIENADHFEVKWHVDEKLGGDHGNRYRLRVAAGGVFAHGYVDLAVGADEKAARSLSVDGVVGVKAGQTLPLKFRFKGPPKPRSWLVQFGTSDSDQAAAVATDRWGNTYIAGATAGNLGGTGNAGGFDAFVRKYDKKGQEVWTRQFGTSGGDAAKSVVTDRKGNVYVVGYTSGDLDGSAGGEDAFVRKYDKTGTEVWSHQFGTTEVDRALSVTTDSSGKVYVVGFTWGALGPTPQGDADAFVRWSCPVKPDSVFRLNERGGIAAEKAC